MYPRMHSLHHRDAIRSRLVYHGGANGCGASKMQLTTTKHLWRWYFHDISACVLTLAIIVFWQQLEAAQQLMSARVLCWFAPEKAGDSINRSSTYTLPVASRDRSSLEYHGNLRKSRIEAEREVRGRRLSRYEQPWSWPQIALWAMSAVTSVSWSTLYP